MKLAIYQVDAFADRPFVGNPAAVCPLDDWLPDELMQSIAAENNLSETAFIVPEAAGYGLRWFTPEVEVDLCGHATLASACVVFERLQPAADRVVFESRSGPLTVTRSADGLEMDFPRKPVVESVLDPELAEILGGSPLAQWRTDRTPLVIYPDAESVRALTPDYGALGRQPSGYASVTAPGTGADADVDFVSRFFAPAAGIDEDPVTGSAHCYLTPYWAEQLGKTRLRARQVSARSGEVECELRGDRVGLRGRALLVLEGHLLLP